MPADFLDRLLAHESYVVTTHLRPDGDAVGSQLALGRFLERQGRTVRLLAADPPPRNLEWLVRRGRIEIVDGGGTLDQRIAVNDADAVVVVDTNTEHRIGEHLGALVTQSGGEKFLIDHHPRPETWFDHHYVRTSASSTGELIYELIAATDPSLIDTETATALYTAIMTDTGSFRFNSVTPKVHEIVADLLRRGEINPEPIHLEIYNNRPLSAYRLLGFALESIRVIHDGVVGYMTVTQNMLHRSGATLEDTEGFVDYVMAVEGVEVAVIFLDLKRNVKASFRSSGTDYPVNEWARHFGGGGHRNASGAYFKGTLSQIVPRVLEAAPRFLPLERSRVGEDWSD